MQRWDKLSDGERDVLQTVFWSAATSRHGLADRLACSKSKANSLIAGLIEQGLVEEVGLLNRRLHDEVPERLQSVHVVVFEIDLKHAPASTRRLLLHEDMVSPRE